LVARSNALAVRNVVPAVRTFNFDLFAHLSSSRLGFGRSPASGGDLTEQRRGFMISSSEKSP
jgi:hypothetical protein